MNLVDPRQAHKPTRHALYIPENPRLRRAHFDAGGEQPLYNPVITERTFIRSPSLRVKIARPVRARLNAVSASDAALGIHQDNAVFRCEGRPHGTDLDAWGILALVAEFRNKETSQDIRLLRPGFSFLSLNARNRNTAIPLYDVPFHPGPTKERFFRNIIFFLAGLDAQAAPNTLLYVNAHSVEVIGWIILSVPGFCLGILQKVPKHSSGGNKQNGIL